MTNREKLIKSLEREHPVNSAHYLLSRVIFSNVFPELSERFGISTIESQKFAEYLEKEWE